MAAIATAPRAALSNRLIKKIDTIKKNIKDSVNFFNDVNIINEINNTILNVVTHITSTKR